MFRRSEHERVEGLLSAYLDGELSREEKALVEEHLKGCTSCADNLESLRQTMELVRQLPAVSLPRSFTISHLVAKERPWVYAYLRGATALAALLLIAFLATDIGFHYLGRGGAALPAPQPILMEGPPTAPEEEERALGLAPEETPLPAERAPTDREAVPSEPTAEPTPEAEMAIVAVGPQAEMSPSPTVTQTAEIPTVLAGTPEPAEKMVELLSPTPSITPSPQPTPEGAAYAPLESKERIPSFLPWLRLLEWLSLSALLLLAAVTAGLAWRERR